MDARDSARIEADQDDVQVVGHGRTGRRYASTDAYAFETVDPASTERLRIFSASLASDDLGMYQERKIVHPIADQQYRERHQSGRCPPLQRRQRDRSAPARRTRTSVGR